MKSLSLPLMVGIFVLFGAGCNPTTAPATPCTQEGKICPDGSTVGRTGPQCEFAPCPAVPTSKDDLIQITSPMPSTVVNSPLTITGQARGGWYFEAQFPVQLFDGNGKLLASAPAHAQGEWMTQNYVPFTATLMFTAPTTTTGTLILKKDNPSDLPQNDNQLSIPVRFVAGK